MKLTKHFQQRWEERVGGAAPSAKEIEQMIEGSVWLQKGQEYFTARGRRRKVLALYWVPAQGVVLKIDKKEKRAITVITANITGGAG